MFILCATLTTAISAAWSRAAATDCSRLGDQLLIASRAGRAEEAARFFQQAEASASCTSQTLAALAHNVAVAYGRVAFEDGRNADERATLLRAGLSYARPWQLVASLADLEKRAQRFVEATKLYQEALDAISDETCSRAELPAAPYCREIAPTEDVIQRIHANAVEARLLAERYIATPVTRNGAPGGLARASFRGFTPRVVALPIHFEFGTSAFTDEGRKAAEDMLRYLTRQNYPGIHLVGHADERGSEAFNQALSEQRAQAVKRFLVEKGYKGKIAASGRGRSEPFKSDDPQSYTQEQRWQLDRRVELARQ